MDNPFTISFGKKPAQYISRLSQTEDIIDTFNADNPSSQAYMIVGVSGAGKTVMLSNVSKEFKENSDWIVMEMNPTRDILRSFAAKLYALPEMNKLFLDAKIDLSLLGIGVSIEKGQKIADIEQAISVMLEIIKKKKYRVLITIDEVNINQYMREFISAYQTFIRNNYPLFLIMSGLYENINSLQNDKSLTFLYRTPKIVLEALNISAITNAYKRIFSASTEEAKYMSGLTKGYPYAFQVLGYLVWKKKGKSSDYISLCEEVMTYYDQILQEYVYEKIWDELSPKEREIVSELSDNSYMKVKDIRERLQYDSNTFTVYRNRLIKKGIITSAGYGMLAISLPRFEVFVKGII